MSRRGDSEGLCSDCPQAEHCTLRAELPAIVWQCEEYGPPAKIEEQAATAEPQAAEPQVTTRRRGLCPTCDHQATCSLSREEGGVWRCEEYA